MSELRKIEWQHDFARHRNSSRLRLFLLLHLLQVPGEVKHLFVQRILLPNDTSPDTFVAHLVDSVLSLKLFFPEILFFFVMCFLLVLSVA